MLDAMVRLWLGIGNVLADRGTRVTLVAAVASGDAVRAVERQLYARSPRTQALQLGARVTWQSAVSLESLLERGSEQQVVVSCRPRHLERSARVSWVVMPEAAWTALEISLAREPAITYQFPAGSVENRSTRRTLAQSQANARWHEMAAFSQVVCWIP
jgi:hypothetical protein